MRRKLWKWVIAAVVLVAAVVAGWQIWLARSSGDTANRSARSRAAMAPSVIRVTRGDIRNVVQASGYLKPVTQQSLSFSTSGQVEEVLVQAGDRVKKGQVLARISNSQADLSLLQARNAYELSRLQDPPATVQEKKMQLDAAQETVDGMTLRAPFDGIVSSVDVAQGDQYQVSKGAAITVFQPGRYQIEANVGEADIEKVQVGQTAEVQITAYPDLSLKGKVSRVALIASNNNGVVTIPVTVEVTSDDPRLRSGLGADVNIISSEAQNVARVPIEAVAPDSEGHYYVTKVTADGQQQVVPVQIGATDGIWVEIKAGLAEGDMVVTNNFALYRNLMAQESANQQSGQRRYGFPGFFGGPPGMEGPAASSQSGRPQQGSQPGRQGLEQNSQAQGFQTQRFQAPNSQTQGFQTQQFRPQGSQAQGSQAMSTLRTFRSLERMTPTGGGSNAGRGF
ncbi:MAG: efflux RND transporter periplasmic adaptor subunit [Limnochordaceae bacterium]|nr:efflux RND transporter periplasmic adaptor subunit [Limnochordaceae bacterium]